MIPLYTDKVDEIIELKAMHTLNVDGARRAPGANPSNTLAPYKKGFMTTSIVVEASKQSIYKQCISTNQFLNMTV